MGSGLYEILGLGVLDPPFLDEETHWQQRWTVKETLELRTACETEPDYLVIPLAGAGFYPESRLALAPLPEWVGRVGTRKARYHDATRRQLAAILALHPLDLVVLWHRARELYQEAGLTLPDPRLVLLSDWD